MNLNPTKSKFSEDSDPEATFSNGSTKFRVRGGAYPMIQAEIGGQWYMVGNADYSDTVARCVALENEVWETLPATADTREVSGMWEQIVSACNRLAPRQPAEDNSPYYTRM